MNMKTKTKQTRRFMTIALLLGMAMLLSLSVFGVGTTDFYLGSVSGEPGDIVNVQLTVSSTATVNSIALYDLTYDTAALTFVGFADHDDIEKKCFLSGFDEEKITIALALTQSEALEGYICNLQFKIKDNAANGTVKVGMTSVVKNNSDVIGTSVSDGSVTIKGSGTETTPSKETDAPSKETDAPSKEPDAPAKETDAPVKDTPTADDTPSSWKNPFTDIKETASYYDAIRFVYENNLFKGMSDTTFEPDTTMNRAMFVTVLGRLEGVDIRYFSSTCSFDDIDTVNGSWYHPYVEWASAKGIVQGYGNGKFGVEDEITVEQAVVILARYAKHTGNYKASNASLAKYTDSGKVADWAVNEMKWAAANGIYTGEGNKLNPQTPASRALLATMMYRYVTVFGK